jgi:hypothetical protein
MWYHNKHMINVLKEMSFCFTETWTTFVNLNNGDKLRSFPLSLDYGGNTVLSSFYLKGWKRYFAIKRPAFVRLAIHPSDIKNGTANKIKDMIARLEDDDYTFITYSELINHTAQ